MYILKPLRLFAFSRLKAFLSLYRISLLFKKDQEAEKKIGYGRLNRVWGSLGGNERESKALTRFSADSITSTLKHLLDPSAFENERLE